MVTVAEVNAVLAPLGVARVEPEESAPVAA